MTNNTSYAPADIETRHYQHWDHAGYFRPHMHLNKPAFSIQLPPPNVTGTLHMGHAFNQTIMDGLTRYHRMKGENVCWFPGTDHAGIATQIVVERQLAQQGISRYDLGRDAFLAKVWSWKEHSGNTITAQMRRIGCSADWTREYFTMDETRAKIVTEVFVRLYEQGLIYRGKRLVNWDPILGTAVSDLEVENVEENGHMWHIRYPLVQNPAEALIVATTRPETLLGDVAVAVHPDDARYQHLIGQQVILPLTGREIPIIADEYVDQAFGTGCVKITPAHDFNDYEVGRRHKTRLINVLDLKATILDSAQVYDFEGNRYDNIALPPAYAHQDRFSARQTIVKDLEAQGYLIKTEAHKLMTPKGDRTGSIIEPMLTDQWFVAMTATAQGGEPDSPFKGLSLAAKAKKAVDDGQVRFIPENWVNTYNQWMNNIQDWCISRQLWWGHQIPAWYDDEGNIYVARSAEDAAKMAANRPLTRDEDVLDTWFSSALVPFSTLGWPEDSAEMQAFLPSNVLVTGYEIIFFWVARMIMMTTHFVGKVPFHDVYIHGMVRDHEGKKMSKSEGNVIDPVDLIDGINLEKLLEKRTTGLRQPEKAPTVIADTKKLFPQGIPIFGADALRFTMASYASLGRNINFDFKRAEGYRNFCNKLWNAAQFVGMNCQDQPIQAPAFESMGFAEHWLWQRLNTTINNVTTALDSYRFDLAAQALYEFTWNDYCDWYIESAKITLRQDPPQSDAARYTLVAVLETLLRLMHPIMPFITEELWQRIAPLCHAKTSDSIMQATWPEVLYQDNIHADAVALMAALQDITITVRQLRAQMALNPGERVPLLIEGSDVKWQKLLPYLNMFARLSDSQMVDALPQNEDAPIGLTQGLRLMLIVEIDKNAEIKRLQKEMDRLQKTLDKLSAKLAQPGYTDKAPAHLVEKDRQALAEAQDKFNQLAKQIQKYQQN